MLGLFKKWFMHECFICRVHSFRKYGVLRYTSAELKDTSKYHEKPLCKECTEVLERNQDIGKRIFGE